MLKPYAALYLTILTRNETLVLRKRISIKTQISCLHYEASFLSSSQYTYCASLSTRKYFYKSYPFGSRLSNSHV